MGLGGRRELSVRAGCCPDSAAQWSKLGHSRPETQLNSTVSLLYMIVSRLLSLPSLSFLLCIVIKSQKPGIRFLDSQFLNLPALPS